MASSSTSTSSTHALCLLLVVVSVTIGAASAAKPLPGSCLMAASTLCANADTNAMRCLRKLAIKGDARVPTACAEAIMAGVTMNPRRNQASRGARLTRMLTEGGTCNGANTCPGSFGSVSNNRCNDVLTGCGGCPEGTHTIVSYGSLTVISSSSSNTRGIACSNICCKAANNGARACCISHSSISGTKVLTSVYCSSSQFGRCQIV